MECIVQLERFGELEGSYSYAMTFFQDRAQWDGFSQWIYQAYTKDPLLVHEFWTRQLLYQENLTAVRGYPGVEELMKEYQTLFHAPLWKLLLRPPEHVHMKSSFTPIYCGMPWIDYSEHNESSED